ncbi:MAG TPA: hypothetical protein PKY59_19370 [Pyrinomonadaceae bacterium]|nr:hypothetical protein [Pyrinomonadaceae bacterium]
MKHKLILLTALTAVGITFSGCSFSVGTGTGSNSNASNTAKPANTATNSATTGNSNASNTTKPDKPKTALTDEKKPEGTAKTAKKSNPVPADWLYVYDETKGYGFSVPAGTTGEQATEGGVDTFMAETPAPSDLGIFVLAFKDKEMSKEDLLNVAVKFLEEMGAKVTPGKLKAESDDYAVADADVTIEGKKGKTRILVGTDVTDNYVMLIGADSEEKFSANEKIIDEIWGSFEMWSGGASNN